MRQPRFRRASSFSESRSSARTWTNIIFLVMALVLLLVAGNKVADGMAACYSRVADPSEETNYDAAGQETDASFQPNIQVIPPTEK